jgi:hypothetical protein
MFSFGVTIICLVDLWSNGKTGEIFPYLSFQVWFVEPETIGIFPLIYFVCKENFYQVKYLMENFLYFL